MTGTGPSTIFWMLWGLTVAICLTQMADAWLRNKDVLGLPFIACGMWLYFFGSMAFNAAVSLPEFLPTWTMECGQLVALLCLIGLLAGWHLTSRAARRRQSYELPRKSYS
jgi:hypothetical protein